MILAAEYIPSPLQLMLTQKSDSLDSPVFPFFPGKTGDVPIPDSRLAGNRDRDIPVSRFGRERESGPPGAAGRGFPHAKALSLLDTYKPPRRYFFFKNSRRPNLTANAGRSLLPEERSDE
jgi:hypothetical protein